MFLHNSSRSHCCLKEYGKKLSKILVLKKVLLILYLVTILACMLTYWRHVTYCEPGVKGNTAQGGTKPAHLSTGAVVKVPLFISQGEVIRVDTRTGEYVSRVKS